MCSKVARIVAAVLCMVIPSALYAYFTSVYTVADAGTDYLIMAGIFLPWAVIAWLFARLSQDKAERVWSRDKTRRLVVCALLTALGVVLGGLLSIPAMPFGTYSLKIGFGVVPVIIAGVLYGPGYGAMVGGLTDFIQAMIFPKGAYIPFFTVIGVLFGFIPGLFFAGHQQPKFPRILISVFAGQTIASVICNTLLLIWLYGLPWEAFIPRIITQAICIPLYSGIVYGCIKLLKKAGVIPQGVSKAQ